MDRPNTLYTAAVQLDNAADVQQVEYRVKKGIGSASPLVQATNDFELTLTDSDLTAGEEETLNSPALFMPSTSSVFSPPSA